MSGCFCQLIYLALFNRPLNTRGSSLISMKQSTLSFASVPSEKKKEPKIEPPPLDLNPTEPPDFESIWESVEDFKKCLEPSWRSVLAAEFTKPYFAQILRHLKSDSRVIFPPKQDVLNAFKYCPFNQVKVVIIGQDPYHEEKQAHGLSFSVRRNVKIPSSLQNMYKELRDEFPNEFTIPKHGYLGSWAKQGVLMLNATLTVVEHEANSMKDIGWLNFVKAAINAVNARLEGVVFLAWGKFAQDICKGVNTSKHCVLKSAHPSGLSANRGFFGNGHFKKTNEYLVSNGKSAICWNSVNNPPTNDE